MRVLIVAGGGGHFVPALAVSDIFPKDWEVLFIGRKYTFEGDSSLSFEYQTAKKLNIPFKTITTGRLQRKFTRHTIVSLFKIPVGFFQSIKIINKFKPDIVLSFGGYLSVPVSFAAYFLHVPIVLHEQTLHAGLANKIVAPLADKICISWKESLKYFSGTKTVLTGNPVRKEILNKHKEQLRVRKSYPVIYITGGSSGSHAFNMLVEGCLEKLLQRYIIVHQTGDAKQFNDFERLQEIKERLPLELKKRYILVKYIDPDKVIEFINQADLVVSRSGINTVTELLYLRKPSLLIPLPYGQKHEQKTNALFMKKMGFAEVADQYLLTPDSFYTLITVIIKDLDNYKKRALEATTVIELNAPQKIMEVVQDVAKKENNKKT